MDGSIWGFFSADQFMPHGMCYLWRLDLLLLHITADVLTGLAYFSIPIVLFLYAYKRPQVEFRPVVYLFTAFILLCGSTHFFNIWVLWNPDYGIQGILKLATALVSVATAVALWPLLPRALQIPLPSEMRAKNEALQEEVTRRYRAEGDLATLNRTLERRIEERTQDLKEKNAALAREVEERKRLQQELEIARRKAEAASHAKSNFLATMSHEIRTPLNGLIGMTDAMLLDRGDNPQAEDLKIVRSSADALLTLLNDILDLSKIEAGKLDLAPGPVDLRRLVHQSESLWRAGIEAKGLDFIVHIDEALPEEIIADGARLRQILQNLLSNALKFTDAGRIVLRLTKEAESVAIAVEDSGMGIPADRLVSVFQEFEQVPEGGGQRGGTGLGLAICRRLADLMAGRIELDSVPGKGSVFTLHMPLATPGTDTRPIAPVTEHRAEAEPARNFSILAVDDNQINRLVATRVLSAVGHAVVTASSGAEALDMMRDTPFDVILMDIRMPGMDGGETLAHLRAGDGVNRETPVIALTADAMAGDREAYLAKGFCDHVTKPIDVRTLQIALDAAVSGARKQAS